MCQFYAGEWCFFFFFFFFLCVCAVCPTVALVCILASLETAVCLWGCMKLLACSGASFFFIIIN